MSSILEILSPIVETLSAIVEMLSPIGEILSLIWEMLSPNFGETLSPEQAEFQLLARRHEVEFSLWCHLNFIDSIILVGTRMKDGKISSA